MRKAIPRAWIDITAGELKSSLVPRLFAGRAGAEQDVSEFETAFARFIETKHALSFSSARSAIYHSLQALNLEKGDEVILPAYTFWVDAEMVLLAGLKPVFVDVDFRSANIDPKKIEGKVSSRTKVILPAHLNGIPAEMGPILDLARKHHLRVIEDCARGCGVRYQGKRLGSSDIGIFSFGYGKNMNLFGGGMVTSSDSAFINRLRGRKEAFRRLNALEFLAKTAKGCFQKAANSRALFGLTLFPLIYGSKVRGWEKLTPFLKIKRIPYTQPPPIFLTRLSRMQARQGIRFLSRIDEHNQKRMENAKILREGLSSIPGLHTFRLEQNPGAEMLYFALHGDRKRHLQRFLLQRGIDAEDESASDLTKMDRFRNPAGNHRFPQAETLDGRVILLPCHPRLSAPELRYIVDKLKEHGSRAQTSNPTGLKS